MTDFTHDSYLNLLKYVQDLGYTIGPFRRFPKSGPYVILRHDIDFSVLKAKEMAELDHKAGVAATFFVLLTSPLYNALSEANIQVMQQIIKLGHEIGLHYDCSTFENLQPNERYNQVVTLANCLGNNLNIKITAISQHKPARSNIKENFPGYADAYSRPFFNDIAYISDSRMTFRGQDVYAFFRNNPRSQLLIHPIWWHYVHKSREEIFEYLKIHISTLTNNIIDSAAREIEDYLTGNSHINSR